MIMISKSASAAAIALVLLVSPPAAQAFSVLNTWLVSETTLGPDRVRLSLGMLPIHRGGAGEARLTFMRRAEELARAAGYTGFEIVDYSEGIESGMVFGQRVAEGTVRFTGKSAEPSRTPLPDAYTVGPEDVGRSRPPEAEPQPQASEEAPAATPMRNPGPEHTAQAMPIRLSATPWLDGN
ncbi:MAG: hypothetical protein WBP72_03470 [Rhodocyclaceae bacterium]